MNPLALLWQGGIGGFGVTHRSRVIPIFLTLLNQWIWPLRHIEVLPKCQRLQRKGAYVGHHFLNFPKGVCVTCSWRETWSKSVVTKPGAFRPQCSPGRALAPAMRFLVAAGAAGSLLCPSLGARRHVVRVWSPGPCKGTAKGSGHLTLGAIQTTGCSVGEFGSLEGHGDGLRVPDNLPNNVKGKVTTRAAPVWAGRRKSVPHKTSSNPSGTVGSARLPATEKWLM